MNIANQLTQLRKQMADHRVDFYYVPAADAHNNEYVPAGWQRRAWISGFTGSAGDVIIAQDNAYLWTDARYFLQAEQELDDSLFTTLRQQQGATPPIHIWLKQNTKQQKIATDPKLISIRAAHRWQAALASAESELVAIDNNLVDAIWDDQPAIEYHPIKMLDVKYTGQSVEEKLRHVRAAMQKMRADAHVITMLDAIAWLFNIRGTDIDFNPVVISYALITQDTATLFVNPAQVTDEVKAALLNEDVTVAPYDTFATALNKLNTRVLVEPSTASWWVEQQLANATLILEESPITLLKAIKNPTEQKGMHEAHRLDAIAECKFLCWLEKNWQGQTEISASDQLEKYRREEPRLQGLSFSTISGYADHGAIIHYFATPESNRQLDDKTLYLIDSGAQYLEGTTDITRTLHFGQPTEEEKHLYTLVLKGHLALRHLKFPQGTNGEHINAIAHAPLWQEAMDYSHGTGHGVGCYLCVHEGPQRISSALTGVPLVPGMIVSNEPGVYLKGQFGIRIENLCLIKEVATVADSKTGHGPFYSMEDLTKVPYARNLINKDELSPQEIAWIDEYHQEIFELLKDDLSEEVRLWLEAACKPL